VTAGRLADLKRRAVTGALWSSLETSLQQLLQFGIFLVLSRLLGPEAYGVLALALMVNVVADVLIVTGGWTDTIIQRRDLAPEHLSSIFWLLLALALGLAGLAALAAAPAAALFDVPALAGLMPILALQLPLGALSVVPVALLRRELRFAPLALRGLLALTLAGIAAIALALAGAGVWSLVALHLLQPALGAAVLWGAVGWRPSWQLSPRHLREVLPFVTGVMGERAVQIADGLLPRLVIGLRLGPLALGHYTMAYKVMELLIQLVTRPVGRVMLPSAARLADDPERLRRLVAAAVELLALLVFPAAAGIAIVAPLLVPLVFGPAWVGSVPALQALMVTAAIAPFSAVTAALMYSAGRTHQQFALAAIATLVLILLLAMLGVGDVAAVTLAMALRSLLMLPLRLWLLQRTIAVDLSRVLPGALPPLVATGCMAAGLLALRLAVPEGTPPSVALATTVLAGAALYAALVLLLAPQALRRGRELLRVARR
jgi:O-antigen/teichoic acid export membrane protein